MFTLMKCAGRVSEINVIMYAHSSKDWKTK